jgi:quinol monooxygenase YgiN
MIHVIAALELNPGARPAFMAEFQKIVHQVRAERGCFEYVATIDADTSLPSQRRIGPDAVTIVEKWESAEALAAHDRAAHMLAFRERVRDLVRARDIRMLTPA